MTISSMTIIDDYIINDDNQRRQAMTIINDDIINGDNQLIGQKMHHPKNAVLSTYFRNSDITRCR